MKPDALCEIREHRVQSCRKTTKTNQDVNQIIPNYALSRAWDAQFKISISYLPLRRHDPALELIYALNAAKTEYAVAISYSAELPAACSGARKGQEKPPTPSRAATRILHNLVFTTPATPASCRF